MRVFHLYALFDVPGSLGSSKLSLNPMTKMVPYQKLGSLNSRWDLAYKVKIQCPAWKIGCISLLPPCCEGMETTRNCPFSDYSGIHVYEELLSISLT